MAWVLGQEKLLCTSSRNDVLQVYPFPIRFNGVKPVPQTIKSLVSLLTIPLLYFNSFYSHKASVELSFYA